MKNRHENVAPRAGVSRRAHFVLALGVCLLALLVFSLVGCGEREPKTPPIVPEAPTELTLDDGMLSWRAPAGAQSYLVHIGEEQYETTTPSFDLFDCLRSIGVYKIYVQAVGTEATALSPLSEPIGYALSMPNGLTLKLRQEGDGYRITDADPALVKGRILIPDRAGAGEKPIVEVSNQAFRDCTELTEVVLPDTVTKLGKEIFRNCSALTDATIPTEAYKSTIVKEPLFGIGATEVVDNGYIVPIGMFKGCTSLTSITVESEQEPAGLHGGRLVLPAVITDISGDAFADCTVLTAAELPQQMLKFNTSIFNGCTALTSLTLPQELRSLHTRAFKGCPALTALTIPASVTSVSNSMSYGSFSPPELSLTSITVEAGNPVYESVGNCVIRKDDHRLVLGCASSVIPAYVTAIENGAFAGCAGLTSITLPDGVTSVGRGAFMGCSGLTSITLPDGVTSIREGAFYGCTSLTSITLPEGLVTLGEMIVETSRPAYAWPVFGNCPRLTALEIPASVTLIEQGALGWCESLQNLTVAAGNAVYRSEGNCIIRRADDALVAYGATDTIPESVRILLPFSIFGLTCTSFRLPSGVEEIKEKAIFLCESLEQVYVPQGASYTTGMLYSCPLATIVPYDPET